MKITSKGQVTIPQEIREKFGYLPETEVAFKVSDNGEVLLVKETEKDKRGDEMIKHMTGRLKGGMTTDQLMALLRDDD